MFTVSASTTRVEEERQDAVDRRHAPNDLAGDGHVGDLRGHSDDQREVEKIPIVRLAIVGKTQSADLIRRVTRRNTRARSGTKISYGRKSTTAGWLRTHSTTLSAVPPWGACLAPPRANTTATRLANVAMIDSTRIAPAPSSCLRCPATDMCDVRRATSGDSVRTEINDDARVPSRERVRSPPRRERHNRNGNGDTGDDRDQQAWRAA